MSYNKTTKLDNFYKQAGVYKTARTQNKNVVLFISRMTPEIEALCKQYGYEIASSKTEYAPEIQGVAIITDYRGVF